MPIMKINDFQVSCVARATGRYTGYVDYVAPDIWDDTEVSYVYDLRDDYGSSIGATVNKNDKTLTVSVSAIDTTGVLNSVASTTVVYGTVWIAYNEKAIKAFSESELALSGICAAGETSTEVESSIHPGDYDTWEKFSFKKLSGNATDVQLIQHTYSSENFGLTWLLSFIKAPSIAKPITANVSYTLWASKTILDTGNYYREKGTSMSNAWQATGKDKEIWGTDHTWGFTKYTALGDVKAFSNIYKVDGTYPDWITLVNTHYKEGTSYLNYIVRGTTPGYGTFTGKADPTDNTKAEITGSGLILNKLSTNTSQANLLAIPVSRGTIGNVTYIKIGEEYHIANSTIPSELSGKIVFKTFELLGYVPTILGCIICGHGGKANTVHGGGGSGVACIMLRLTAATEFVVRLPGTTTTNFAAGLVVEGSQLITVDNGANAGSKGGAGGTVNKLNIADSYCSLVSSKSGGDGGTYADIKGQKGKTRGEIEIDNLNDKQLVIEWGMGGIPTDQYRGYSGGGGSLGCGAGSVDYSTYAYKAPGFGGGANYSGYNNKDMSANVGPAAAIFFY